MKSSIVKDKSYTFALRALTLGKALRDRREYELAGQIIRAGTSIGANIEEALASISRREFAAKMCIALKEARETHYWLRLVRDSKIAAERQIAPLLDDAEEILRILSAIVKTSRASQSPATINSQLKIIN